MAVKIRLARHGAKKRPYYRVVVIDSRARREGRAVEEVGRYNPCVDPAMVKLDLEKIDSWIAKGAQPSEPVARLIAVVRGEAPEPKVRNKKSKKQIAREKAAE